MKLTHLKQITSYVCHIKPLYVSNYLLCVCHIKTLYVLNYLLCVSN